MLIANLKATISGFIEDNCPLFAAAIAYTSLFSIPAMLVVALPIAGLLADYVVKDANARELVAQEVVDQVGAEILSPDQVIKIIDRVRSARHTGPGFAISIGVLLFTASAIMVQLQGAMNQVWDVQPDPKKGGVRSFLFKRLLSIMMVAGVGALLLVSVVMSSLLSAVAGELGSLLPEWLTGAAPLAISLITNFVVLTLMFAAMFKWLPDAQVAWRHVWIGAVVTAVLFLVGKQLLAAYFGMAGVGSAYGAAGSLALILVWVYYSAMILLLGAEFTKAYAVGVDGEVTPVQGAVRIERSVVRPAG